MPGTVLRPDLTGLHALDIAIKCRNGRAVELLLQQDPDQTPIRPRSDPDQTPIRPRPDPAKIPIRSRSDPDQTPIRPR